MKGYKSNETRLVYLFKEGREKWKERALSKQKKCNVTLSQIKQTKLSFLRPTSQRSKARYHNLDILVNWGLNIVQYWKKQDFSLISTEFIIDRETLFLLREELDQTSLIKLAKILGTKASNRTYFCQIIMEKVGQELCQKKGLIISQAAELGRRKFLEKLGWLLDYEKELYIYAEILEVFANAKKQLIKQGLHQKSQSDWLELTKEFSDSPWVQKAQQKVTQYLGIEGQKIPKTQVFLATSDIIESIFGKYKIFASSASNSEINEMILTLVLSTTKLTPDKVLQAMETIHIHDVYDWSKEVFGQSMLSKRKLAFSTSTNCIKVA